MKEGINDLIAGIETCVNSQIEKSGGVIMRSCMIKSFMPSFIFISPLVCKIVNRLELPLAY